MQQKKKHQPNALNVDPARFWSCLKGLSLMNHHSMKNGISFEMFFFSSSPRDHFLPPLSRRKNHFLILRCFSFVLLFLPSDEELREWSFLLTFQVIFASFALFYFTHI